MDEHARVLDTFHSDRKEEPGLSNTQFMYTWLKFIGVDENTVMSRFAMPPGITAVCSTKGIAWKIPISGYISWNSHLIRLKISTLESDLNSEDDANSV